MNKKSHGKNSNLKTSRKRNLKGLDQLPHDELVRKALFLRIARAKRMNKKELIEAIVNH